MWNGKGFIPTLMIMGAIVGGAIVWLAPILWGWIKPLIHMLTA